MLYDGVYKRSTSSLHKGRLRVLTAWKNTQFDLTYIHYSRYNFNIENVSANLLYLLMKFVKSMC